MKTRDEIFENFIKLIKVAGDDSNPIPLTEEQYRDLSKGVYSASGESEWTAGEGNRDEWKELFKQSPTEWSPSGSEEEPVLLTNRNIPAQPGGESEWEPSDETDPEQSDPGYKYHPDEKVYRGPRREDDPLKGRYSKKPKEESKPEVGQEKMSDQELLSMIKREPEHLVTNLMIQRDPKYADFNTMYLLVKSLHKWMEESGINPEEGSILYEEANYMLDFLNKKMDEKDKSEKSE